MRIRNLTILLISCLLVGCIQQEPEACDTFTVGSGEFPDAPPLVLTVEDPREDFILDHPFFELTFDVAYHTYDIIPETVDIVRVDLERIDDVYYFHIFPASAPDLGEEGVLYRFGVFVDTDLNGVSDLLLTTTAEPDQGVVTASDFRLIEEMPLLMYDVTSLTVSASADVLGDHFEWVAFTAYSPQEVYYETPLEDVYFMPAVDLAYAGDEKRVLVYTSVSGTGWGCHVTETGITTCPPLGNPPGRRRVPGSLCEGWMLKQKQCNGLKIELWCNCSSGGPPWVGGAFGKWVQKGFFRKGWVAKCPFNGGHNSQVEEDEDLDGIPDKVYHAVSDMGLDDDGDGYWDVMLYVYDFRTNLVTITNIERDYHTGAVVNVRSLPPLLPFIEPNLVPGSVMI